jgi:FkbM family methyltransferase
LQHNPYIYAQIDLLDGSCAPIPARLAEQYSQCGEDVIVSSLLEALLRTRADIQIDASIYIEIGANHPISGSNTFLLCRRGYRGVLVEANPKLIPELRKLRPTDIIINAAITPYPEQLVDLHISNQHELSSLNRNFVTSWHEGKIGISETLRVPSMRVNDLLQQHTCGKTIVYLSIDIEGLDCSVLADMDFEKWRPILIQAEPSDHFISAGSNNIINLLDSKNYLLIGVTDVNLLFIDRLFLNMLKPEISEPAGLIVYLQKQLDDSRSILEKSKEELSKAHIALHEFAVLWKNESRLTHSINKILEKLLGVRLVRVRALKRLVSSEASGQK